MQNNNRIQSGGGVIFGVTGDVTEAVLRRLTNEHSKEAMREIADCGVRGADSTTIIKKSDENPLVLELYNGLLKGKEHELLHNESYE